MALSFLYVLLGNIASLMRFPKIVRYCFAWPLEIMSQNFWVPRCSAVVGMAGLHPMSGRVIRWILLAATKPGI